MGITSVCIATLRALAWVIVLQGAMATGLIMSVNQSGCHNSNIILNCPAFPDQSLKPDSQRWRIMDPAAGWKDLVLIKKGKMIVFPYSQKYFGDRLTSYPNGSLEIKSLKAQDETQYKCMFKVDRKRETHIVELSVSCDGKTTVSKREVCSEDVVTLECDAKHRANPRKIERVTWHKRDGNAAWSMVAASDRVVNQDFRMNQNYSLELQAGKEGEEKYRCAVSKNYTAAADERHIVTLKNVNCRREKRQIGNIKTTSGRVGMVTTTPVVTTMETTTEQTPSPSQVTKVCGGVLTSVSGGFHSPNFPSAYPANSYCKWTISVPKDYAAIDITLDKMNLEHEGNCQNDYISIYDELGNEVGCRRCGSYKSPMTTTVRGRHVTFVFESDSTEQRTGFKLTYSATKDAQDP